MIFLKFAIFSLMLVMQSCRSIETHTPSDALVINYTDSSLSELRNAIDTFLNRKNVIISDSAFIKSNKLIVQRREKLTPSGQIIDGRSYEIPFVFLLTIKNSQCYLEYQGPAKQVLLSQLNCKIKSL